ncbi:MAG: NADH-quinone oxidoreductase subunit NuoF [bacterium]
MEERILLANCGVIDPEDIESYQKAGGYNALKKVLSAKTPEGVIAEIETSGLRGRGGAAFPTGLKWKFTRQAKGDEKYIVCNADEGEPGTFKDRMLLEADPHHVLEGLIIAGFATGAKNGYIFIRGEYGLSISRVEKAIKQAREKGFLGEDILGSGFSFNAHLRVGAGAYICGEETALFAAIEGKRGIPRLKPPFPPTAGLWQKPTAINNVETLANIPLIIDRGAEWYAGLGTESSKGIKIFCLSGAVKSPGLYEAPFGVTLRHLIYEKAGGMKEDKPLKAILCGGAASGFLSSEHLDTPLDYQSLPPLGSGVGSGAIAVFAEGADIVDLVRQNAGFFLHESCGACIPCRIGSKQIYDILSRLMKGEGREADIDLLVDLAETMKVSSRCGLGMASPTPLLTAIRYFRADFLAKVN